MGKDYDFLNKLRLPGGNPKEELEQISIHEFLPLFDPKFFEIRQESYRDKGIDFSGEIKLNGRPSNFRFNIQLKATEKVTENKDGTISLQIQTSNINYLLNGGISAYYVLYIKESRTFYFANMGAFVGTISKQNKDWNKQKSYVLRFKDNLTDESVMEIYDETKKRGLANRTISEMLAYKSATIASGDQIHIDYDLNVSSDQEIRKLIENYGLVLIGEGRWKEILLVHGNASANIAVTAKYNLILGIANFYAGNSAKALGHLQDCKRNKQDLESELQQHLEYFENSIKYSLGMINHEEYLDSIGDLESSSDLGVFVKIEKIKSKYLQSDDQSTLDFDQIIEELSELVSGLGENSNARIIAEGELILYEGFRNNMDYVSSVAMINALENQTGPVPKIRIDAVRKMIKSNMDWGNRVESIKKKAVETKNNFGYYVALINEIKVKYEFIVFTSMVNITREIPGMPPIDDPGNEEQLDKMIRNLEQAFAYFSAVEHIDNLCVVLSVRYEIQHFLKRYKDAENTLTELQTMVERYDLPDFKKKMEFLRNKGTTHEKFGEFVDSHVGKSEREKKEVKELVEQMKKLDKDELSKNYDTGKCFDIYLFPIGTFKVPVSQKSTAFKILGIEGESIQQSFSRLIEAGVMPVANILTYPITAEGPGRGREESRGLSSWKNIYRIRKAFFDSGYLRVRQ